MCLDITSHPGRPGLDEPVPSRYADFAIVYCDATDDRAVLHEAA